MTNLPKRLILSVLNDLGYVLVKKPDYEEMKASVPSPQRQVQVRADPRPPSPEHAELHSLHTGASAPARARAVSDAIRYLIDARVPGDVVDCGDGSPATLAAIAATLVSIGDTSRRLILFDVSGDPTHAAETTLTLWGTGRDLLGLQRADMDRGVAKSLPRAVGPLTSRYPPERISVVRYPANALHLPTLIAYLGLMPDSYPANRNSITSLIPRLSDGGIVAVTGGRSPISPRDAVEEALREFGTTILLHRITDSFRIGVKCSASHDASKQSEIS